MSATESSAGSDRERRSFYRVEARIPIRLRVLDAEEAVALASEIATPLEEPLPLVDPALAAAFQRLERKLDRVLAFVDSGRSRPLAPEDARPVSLSAAGVALEPDAGFEATENVLVELQLPGPPPRSVRAIAHAVGECADAPDAKDGRLPLAFDVIAEADREAIVRFSHDVQRVQLRARALESRSG